MSLLEEIRERDAHARISEDGIGVWTTNGDAPGQMATDRRALLAMIDADPSAEPEHAHLWQPAGSGMGWLGDSGILVIYGLCTCGKTRKFVIGQELFAEDSDEPLR